MHPLDACAALHSLTRRHSIFLVRPLVAWPIRESPTFSWALVCSRYDGLCVEYHGDLTNPNQTDLIMVKGEQLGYTPHVLSGCDKQAMELEG